jgi:predicted alpha/beta superfamily hydrolase
VSPAWAASFLGDGGTFLTLNREGLDTKFQMSYSSGGEPQFDGADLGTFSTLDGSVLRLEGFENATLESMGTSISLGWFFYRIYPEGSSAGGFVTNVSTGWRQLDVYKEVHYATNMNINLLADLAPGRYELEVYAEASGNFSPNLVEDNNGSNYVARFSVTDEALPVPSNATENGKMEISFSYMTNTVFGEEVFVVGSHPDLGDWYPVNARKLHWSEGNVWTGSIAITANTDIRYKYIVRTNTGALFCDPDNTIWMDGDDLTVTTPALPAAPATGKQIYYCSGWTNVSLFYQCGADTNWYTQPMTNLGQGRSGAEFLHRVNQVGKTGERIEFVMSSNDGDTNHWDKFIGDSNYYTQLDAFLLQDGGIYNYWPPAAATVSTIHTTYISSAYAPTIPSRNIRIYLPRNYATNTWKSYPVLYMHDGQNDFRPGGAFGCWYAEDAADEMIARGMMRESIIVAVDNTSERMWEYVPPDGDAGEGAGTADQYARFLVEDVKTYVDANYRTLPDEQNTATLGSSLGGLVSIYLGLSTNVFGKVGPMSPSFWAATNFVATAIDSGDSSGLRIYMDCGTNESSEGDPMMWDYMWAVYNLLQIDGYTENATLMTRVGCGHEHSEWAWAERVPGAFAFLLDARDEENRIAATANQPQLAAQVETGTVDVAYAGYKGVPYVLQRTDSLLTPAWTGVTTGRVEALMWYSGTLSDTNPPAGGAFYRVVAP